MKEGLEKLIGKHVNIFYNSGDKAFRALGIVLEVDDMFLILEDPQQGVVYIGLNTITKIDFQSELDLKGGAK